MTIDLDGAIYCGRGGAALGVAVMPGAVLAQAQENPKAGQEQKPDQKYEFLVKDPSSTSATAARRGWRGFYQPSGSGPFPAVLQIHGGAWTNKNRTDGQNTRARYGECRHRGSVDRFSQCARGPLPRPPCRTST